MEIENWITQLLGLIGYMFIAWIISLIAPITFTSTFGILSIGLMMTVIYKSWRDNRSNDVKS